ncbi:D-TA family PLP-dependent enzyme [Mucilaginibacter gotjawali]|uniref:D-threonine aldolase n=2 Tax=Mucilaginibacter gotjawali TaxID=1550579 RepID=A0A0X8X263_9SPHI|nr:D-TA family PLP-dependent enzyme [Mucilaginibacter gotjawali]MBB3054105.1 D-serine deaminase-like pyridoxal phosphate-dependent protein [Mucilaginibacter gotjawali]BAU54374.1 D-threonine aldolase [Mucilaginibacter gotjawali]
MTEKEWYIIGDVDQLDTPALVVYPGRVKHNIALVKSMIDDVGRLRPHVKTYKNMEVTRLMLDAGITKFKCATIAEAEMLGMCKAPDVLLAYQPVGPKLKRFVKLILTYPDTKYACVIDNIHAATEISLIAVNNNIVIPVYIDLNVGMNRTGISPGNDARLLYMECAHLPGIIPVGLHAYDGHIHDEDINTRTRKCNECFEPIARLQADLKHKGYPEPVIVAGGSPTFPIHAKRENIECSPGTFVYWDKGYLSESAEQEFLTAALVVSRVISLPDETKICLDLGHKSVAAEKELAKRVLFLNAPELIMLGQSEEHLVAEAGKGHNYMVGDVLYGLPYHVCPSVALYERAITIENQQITGEWKNIARDRKITI